MTNWQCESRISKERFAIINVRRLINYPASSIDLLPDQNQQIGGTLGENLNKSFHKVDSVISIDPVGGKWKKVVDIDPKKADIDVLGGDSSFDWNQKTVSSC